jgi:hypothetical protein
MRFVVEAAEVGFPQSRGVGQLLASRLPVQDLHSAAGSIPSSGPDKHGLVASLSPNDADSRLKTSTLDAGTPVERLLASASGKAELNSARAVEIPPTQNSKSPLEVAESHFVRALKLQVRKPSASTREMAESQPNDPPVESSVHSHKKLGKVRA